MTKIDRRDYQISGHGLGDTQKQLAEKILALMKEEGREDSRLWTDIDVQDFEVEVFANSDILGHHPTAYVIDIQIKGLGKKSEG